MTTSWMWWRWAAATTDPNRSAAAGEEASRSRAHVAPAASSSLKSASMPAALSPQNSMKSYSETAFPLAVAGEGYGIVPVGDGVAEVEPGGEVLLGWVGDGVAVRPPDVQPASAEPASRPTARVTAGTRRWRRRICPPSASSRCVIGVHAESSGALRPRQRADAVILRPEPERRLGSASVL